MLIMDDQEMYFETDCRTCLAMESALVMDSTRDKLLAVLGHQDWSISNTSQVATTQVSSCDYMTNNILTNNMANTVTNNVTNSVANKMSCDLWQVMDCLNHNSHERRTFHGHKGYIHKGYDNDFEHDLVHDSCNCNILALAWGTLCPCRRGFLELIHAHIREEHDKPLGRRQQLGVQCTLLEAFLQQVRELTQYLT